MSLRERFGSWARAEGEAAPVDRFRAAFAAIWLSYDVLDVATAGTARIHNWLETGSPAGLLAIQLALIACELTMLVGRPVRFVQAATLAAALLRGCEWLGYLRLNDFAYFGVTALILAHARPGGRAKDGGAPPAAARWPRDVLVWEAAWIYFATGLMKLNPTWLSGRHLFVRLGYMHDALAWPYPPFVVRCAESLPCDAALAAFGVIAELTLAALLVLYPRRSLVAVLAAGIHTFGALATNVWFFGPSIVAQVALLTRPGAPRDERRLRSAGAPR